MFCSVKGARVEFIQRAVIGDSKPHKTTAVKGSGGNTSSPKGRKECPRKLQKEQKRRAISGGQKKKVSLPKCRHQMRRWTYESLLQGELGVGPPIGGDKGGGQVRGVARDNRKAITSIKCIRESERSPGKGPTRVGWGDLTQTL